MRGAQCAVTGVTGQWFGPSRCLLSALVMRLVISDSLWRRQRLSTPFWPQQVGQPTTRSYSFPYGHKQFCILFKSYCICMYDVALWKFFKKGTMDRFRSCYNKCVKAFFGYKRYDSLTKVLMDTGIPTFNAIILFRNCKYAFDTSWSTSCNKLVSSLRISLVW